jgi:hypothetical protein
VQETSESDARAPAPLWRRLGGLVRPWRLLKVLRDRRRARRTCIDALQLYREVAATCPDLSNVARYAEVVARHTGADPHGARVIIERAEDSFASWPVERPLNFRDVVQYLVVCECLHADPRSVGTSARLAAVIGKVIPDHL